MFYLRNTYSLLLHCFMYGCPVMLSHTISHSPPPTPQKKEEIQSNKKESTNQLQIQFSFLWQYGAVYVSILAVKRFIICGHCLCIIISVKRFICPCKFLLGCFYTCVIGGGLEIQVSCLRLMLCFDPIILFVGWSLILYLNPLVGYCTYLLLLIKLFYLTKKKQLPPKRAGS